MQDLELQNEAHAGAFLHAPNCHSVLGPTVNAAGEGV